MPLSFWHFLAVFWPIVKWIDQSSRFHDFCWKVNSFFLPLYSFGEKTSECCSDAKNVFEVLHCIVSNFHCRSKSHNLLKSWKKYKFRELLLAPNDKINLYFWKFSDLSSLFLKAHFKSNVGFSKMTYFWMNF